MFDRVDIRVQAGRGGDGVISFRREKHVPFGGPDGGDGGKGGAVVIKASAAVSNLALLRHGKLYKAGNGENGRGQRKHGKSGADLILAVPVGTVISNKTRLSADVGIADLLRPGLRAVVAEGGRGGLGNSHFASSTNQAPQIAQKGGVSEEKVIILELKLIADVGIIGYPNVGKSSLLAAASAAKPKIANYPFTTLEPALGVVETNQWSFIIAEIPGLITGAHFGRGLGYDFLRHVVRTKVLLHLVDGSSVSPAEDMLQVNNELKLFDSALAQKPQLVAVNKIDLPQVRVRLAELMDIFNSAGTKAHFVSAATGEGVAGLVAKAFEVLAQVTAGKKADGKVPKKVFRPKPRQTGIRVRCEKNVFVVMAPELERTVAGTNLTNLEARRQLLGWFIRVGLGQALKKAGVKPGDKIRLGELEWSW